LQAYAGFHSPDFKPGDQLAGVASGNWGCGVFGGDPKLKTLLQLMAASEAGRHLAYFTFGNRELGDQAYHMYTFLTDKQVTVGKHFVHMKICTPHTLHHVIVMNVGRRKIHELLGILVLRNGLLIPQPDNLPHYSLISVQDMILRARCIYLIPSCYVPLNHSSITLAYHSFLSRNIPYKILVYIFCSSC
jgi:hypothetical protein